MIRTSKLNTFLVVLLTNTVVCAGDGIFTKSGWDWDSMWLATRDTVDGIKVARIWGAGPWVEYKFILPDSKSNYKNVVFSDYGRNDDQWGGGVLVEVWDKANGKYPDLYQHENHTGAMNWSSSSNLKQYLYEENGNWILLIRMSTHVTDNFVIGYVRVGYEWEDQGIAGWVKNRDNFPAGLAADVMVYRSNDTLYGQMRSLPGSSLEFGGLFAGNVDPGDYYLRVSPDPVGSLQYPTVRVPDAGSEHVAYGAGWSVGLVLIGALPAKPSLASPSNGSNQSGTTVSFSWSSAARASSYYYEIDDNSDFSSPEFKGSTSGLSVSVGGLPNDGTRFWWRVKGQNENGSGPWSDVWWFDNGQLPPPNAPTVTWNNQGLNTGDAQKVTVSGSIPIGATKLRFFLDADGTTYAYGPVAEISHQFTGIDDSQTVQGSLQAYTDSGKYSEKSARTPCPIPDCTQPTPDPLTWRIAPYQTGTSSIFMGASVASDTESLVVYYFDCGGSPTGGSGGSDSERTGSEYSDGTLSTNHQYKYRVRAEDRPSGNYTGYSDWSYEYTDIENPQAVECQSTGTTSVQIRIVGSLSGLSRGSSGLYIENKTTGHSSGWKQDNNWWTCTGLTPNSRYSFRAKARNGDADETGWCPENEVCTLAEQPGAGDFNEVTETGIQANWTTEGNPAGTEYMCENTTKGENSGWITSNSWNNTNLQADTAYCYQVKARNKDGVETSFTDLGCQETLPALPTSSIGRSPDCLDFSSWESVLTFEVWNAASQTLDYIVADDADWVSIDPAGGLSEDSNDRKTHLVTVDRSGFLPDEEKTAVITISSDGADNSPQTITVIAHRSSLGSISGRVTRAADGSPIQGLQVVAYGYPTWSSGGSNYTDSNGVYEIDWVQPGTYRVVASTYGTDYVPEYYDDARDIGSATPVSVVEGERRTSIDFALTVGGKITGTVVNDSNGSPISGVYMYVGEHGSGGFHLVGETLDDGTYQITQLATGTYCVWAYPYKSDFVSEYYDNVFEYQDATPVQVIEGQVTSNRDFGLVLGGRISGTVTWDSDDSPIRDLWVYAEDYATGWCESALTDANGSYSINKLRPGPYKVWVSTDDTAFMREYYDDALEGQSATPVDVNVGQHVSGIDFGLAIGGTITGTVTRDSDGAPVPDLWVSACGYDTESGSGDWTDPNGDYEIMGLPTGIYRVTVSTYGTEYVYEYYDDVFNRDDATPVTVVVGEGTEDVDFGLGLGASISGFVKDSSGSAVEDVTVNCSARDAYYAGSVWTEPNGFYHVGRLPAGYVYRIAAYPPGDSDYVITRICLEAPEAEDYTAPDIVLERGALTVSGTVTDKATHTPLEGIYVQCNLDDLDDISGSSASTDPNGRYTLTNLPSGRVEFRVESESADHACLGSRFELTESVDNLDFALPQGAVIHGKVLDAETAEPIAGIHITYWNSQQEAWQDAYTKGDGTFTLRQLPPGIGEVRARPAVSTGYAWSLPEGGSWIFLQEGEENQNRMIALRKGALVAGYIKDANGIPLGNIGYDWQGKMCEGWRYVSNTSGYYQIRLPLGTYSISLDEENGFTVLPTEVTIDDVNQVTQVDDIVVYSRLSGSQISGNILNPSASIKTGDFMVYAFEAGTVIDVNTWETIQPINEGERLYNPGPFVVAPLPLGSDYDILLCTRTEYPLDSHMDSVVLQDRQPDIPLGTGNVNLYYGSEGGTVIGTVGTIDGRPIVGADVLLTAYDTGSFAAFAVSDCNGAYEIYNVRPGTYFATASHCRYTSAPAIVAVYEGAISNAVPIIADFSGEKEGPDLNGDGIVDFPDLRELSNEWLQADLLESNFNQDANVNLTDFARLAESWLWRAVWYSE